MPAKTQAPIFHAKGNPFTFATAGVANSNDRAANTYDPIFVEKASESSQKASSAQTKATMKATVNHV